jgi:LysM repeat protein
MGIIGRFLMVAFFCLISFSELIAQEVPSVHKINGKKYYLHVVEKGNTLYGIARQYSITVGDIQRENKDALVEGLRENQTLLILVTDDNKKDLTPVIQTTDFLIHKVQPKETLYSISKQYNSSLESILLANPEVKENGLKTDAEIKIPLKSVQVSEAAKVQAKPDPLASYTVKKGETAYGIAKSQGVSLDELAVANSLFPTGIREGMVIRIPKPRSSVAPVVKESTQNDGAESPKQVETAVTPNLQTLDSNTYHIGLLLPMNPVSPNSGREAQFTISEHARVALSFYRGFQFGVDSFSQKLSVKCKITLYSVGNDSASLKAFTSKAEFDSLHVLVGPFYTDQFEKVATKMAQHGGIAICPMPKPSKLLFRHPNAVKTTPSESMQLNSLAEYIASEMKDSNLLLVNSNKFQDQENVEFFKTQYARACGVPDTFSGDAIREIKLWNINYETMKMRFRDSGSYVLIVPSTNRVFITKFLSELYNLTYREPGKYHFRLIGLSEWQKLDEDIDIRHLHQLNVTLPLVSYVDFRNYKINNFYKSYHQKFGFEPDALTLQGFDLAAYLLSELTYSPTEWLQAPEKYRYDGILDVYDFKRIMADSGIENRFIKLFEYDNYTLKEFAQWPIQRMK